MPREDIKALRKIFKLTQKEFGRKFGISVHTIRSWEQGKRRLDSSTIAFYNILAQLIVRKCSTQNFLYELLYEPKHKVE